MKRLFVFLFCTVSLLCSAIEPELIQIPENPTEVEVYAAKELACYIEKSTGKKLAIRKSGTLPEKAAFLIGPALAKSAGGFSGSMDDHTSIVEKRGKYIILTGRLPEVRGNLYAVYDYLEQLLGIRWLTPDAEVVPKHKKIPANFSAIKTQPAFSQGRAVLRGWTSALFSPEQASIFFARMRQTGNWLMFRLGEDGRYGYGIHGRPLGHSMPLIIPHKKYFKKHPEWFALMPDGKRCSWSDTRGIKVAHFCLSNKELQQEFRKELVKYWNKNWKESWHKAGIRNVFLSLSGADNLYYCRCQNCKAEYGKYGHSGQYIRFITPALEELKKQFPEIRFRMSAYLHTLTPPKNMTIPANIVVGIAGLHLDNSKPVTHEQHKGYLENFKAWSKLCKELFYTHYSTNYHNFLFPVDNLFVLAQDYRTVQKMGAVKVYDLSSAGGVGIDFEELRFYVTAKLQADPTRDTRQLIKEFTKGYYGPAAPFVREYIDFLHQKTGESKMRVTSFYKCPAFFDLKYLLRAEDIFDRARKAAASDPVILKRLRKDYLHLIYMDLHWTFLRYTPQEFEKRLTQFETISREFKIKRFDEDTRVTVKTVIAQARKLFETLQKTGELASYPPVRYFSFKNMQEIKLPSGEKIIKVFPKSDNWVLQWICPYFFSCPEKELDVFIEADIRLKANAPGNTAVFKSGFNDGPVRTIRSNTVKKGYHLYPLLRKVKGKKSGSYLFFAMFKDPAVEAVYVKRFVVRPSDDKLKNGK